MKRIGHRLRTARDFSLVFRRGRRKEFPLMRVTVLANRLDHARIALVTPRAAEKRATRRNLVRRRTWEWLRARSAIFFQPIDVVFFFKKEAFSASRKLFYESLADTARYVMGEVRGS